MAQHPYVHLVAQSHRDIVFFHAWIVVEVDKVNPNLFAIGHEILTAVQYLRVEMRAWHQRSFRTSSKYNKTASKCQAFISYDYFAFKQCCQAAK